MKNFEKKIVTPDNCHEFLISHPEVSELDRRRLGIAVMTGNAALRKKIGAQVLASLSRDEREKLGVSSPDGRRVVNVATPLNGPPNLDERFPGVWLLSACYVGEGVEITGIRT